MAQIEQWSTASATKGKEAKHWADILSERLHSMEVSTPGSDEFSATLTQKTIGTFSIGAGQGTAHEVRRTRSHISRSSHHYYGIVYSPTHVIRIQQYGHDTVVNAGQCAFYDSKAPYRISFPDRLDCIGIQADQSWLERWLSQPEDQAARVLDFGGWDKALGPVIEALYSTEFDALPMPASTVLDQLGTLIALAAGPSHGHSRYTGRLVERIRTDIKANCQDLELSAERVASTNGISKRYLQMLLARDGTSFNRELMSARLEVARSLLARPDCSRLTIMEIALRSGFVAPVHFARRFRARFGQAPAAFRRTMHSQSPLSSL